MVTPAALKGRTMFFDWLEVDGPRRAPAPLKLQLISVPGQIERNYRRRPLVQMADVVVFVCDSSPDKIPETLRAFARTRLAAYKVPKHVTIVDDYPRTAAGKVQKHLLRKTLENGK